MKVRFIVNQDDLNSLDVRQSLLLKSKNVSKDYSYIKYDMEGNTSLVQEPVNFDKSFSYRKVHSQKQEIVLGSQIDWKKDMETLKSLMKLKDKIIMRSLRHLYQKNFRPNFFLQIDETQSISFKEFNLQIPMCLYEMDHLSHSHIKSLFLTQNYQEEGIYKISINEDGRFRIITVNDMVPVFAQTNEHIWGVQQPWKLIVLKAWGCINQGYSKILSQHVPFRFLQYFSSSNWKYYNLEREGLKWFNQFKESIKISYIILQTKNTQNVRKMGLIPGITAYNIVQVNTNSKGESQFEIKSRFKHKWKGQLNIKDFSGKIVTNQFVPFRLEKSLILTKKQFFQIFGCAYITSLSKAQNHITDYVKIQIPVNSKNAVYLRFEIKEQSFMDFSFIQSHKNKRPIQTSQSLIDYSIYMKQTGKIIQSEEKYRYLRCKYMLIRKISKDEKLFESKISRESKKSQPELTSRTKYEAYEVDYLRGYNKGEAHFLLMQPGQYFFRLKSENFDKQAIFYFNYCSSEKLKIEQVEIQEDQKQQMLQNCILSILPACIKYKTKNLLIHSGDKFNEMGYGFLVLQNITKAEKLQTVLFSINLQELQMEGFKIKGKKYKQIAKNSKIQFQVKTNQYLILIFKRIEPYLETDYYWPPKSIEIFKAQDTQVLKTSKD